MEELFEKRPFFATMNYAKQLFLLLSVTVFLVILSSTLLGYIAIRFDCFENIHFLRWTQFLNSIIIFLLPALLFSKWANGNIWSYSNLNVQPKNKMFAIVTGLSVCILPVVALVGYLNELVQFPDFLEHVETYMKTMEEHARDILLLMTENKTIPILLLNLLLMAVTPAICEEFFFRGALQPLLQKWSKNKHLAIWITAFIFSAIHLQFYGFIPRFFLGVYLGYLMIWSGSIRLPIFAHFLHNGLSIVFDFFAGKDENMELFEQITPEMMTPLLSWAALAVVGIFFGIRVLYKERK